MSLTDGRRYVDLSQEQTTTEREFTMTVASDLLAQLPDGRGTSNPGRRAGGQHPQEVVELRSDQGQADALGSAAAGRGGKARKQLALDYAGERRLNHALHIAAVVQYRMPGAGQDYYWRKRAAGKTHNEALRCLKRRISGARPRPTPTHVRRAGEPAAQPPAMSRCPL
jgi:hypothetical protein